MAANDQLDAGQVVTDTFSVATTDGGSAQVVITITGTNDAPTITADSTDATGTVTETADVVGGTDTDPADATGTITFADVDITDQHDVTVSATVKDGSGNTIASPVGSLALSDNTDNTDGTVGWTFSVDNTEIDYLAAGESLTQVYTVTVDDENGGTVTQDITITINGTNDAPVVDAVKSIYMPDATVDDNSTTDRNENQLVNEYANGYPLDLNYPTDVDGDKLTVTVTGLPGEGQVLYTEDGTTYVIVRIDDELTEVQFESLVYIPDGNSQYDADTGAPISGADSGVFSYSVNDGTSTVNGSVNINTVLSEGPHEDNVQVGNGSSPLTSGNDQTIAYVVTQSLSSQSSFSSAAINLETDFSSNNNDLLSSEVENQVDVTLSVNGVVFSVIAAGNGVTDWTENLGTDDTSDTQKGAMWTTSVTFDQIVDGAGQTLSDYLDLNPPTSGDSWVLTYSDNTGGKEQARYLNIGVVNSVEGSDSVVIEGADTDDILYGSTAGGDSLIDGKGGDDQIFAREGGDLLVGGTGNDTMTGGLGDDIFAWSLSDTTGDQGTKDAPASDTITDFNQNGETGDAIRLTDLLDVSTISDDDSDGSINDELSAVLDNYLKIESIDDGNGNVTGTKISIATDGSVGAEGGDNFDQIITLDGVDFVGSETDQAAIIQSLLDSSKLIID